MILTILDEVAMRVIGEQLAKASLAMFESHPKFQSSINFYLSGELGAGKTTLVRGFLQAMGYSGRVKSPTYTLLESYTFEHHCVYHFDFYRIHHPRELAFMGLQDYFDQASICLIEWPEQALPMLPAADIFLRIEIQEQQRRMELKAFSQVGHTIMEHLKHAHPLGQ